MYVCWLGIILYLIADSASGQQCHQDWVYHDGSCYGFGEDQVTWGDAQVTCLIFNAKLAEIETSAENEFLKTMAHAKNGAYYWLGGTDIFHEGVWEWVSSRTIISSFTDWSPGSPGDTNGGQDCLCMDKRSGYTWNDGDCEAQFDFICEASPLETVVG